MKGMNGMKRLGACMLAACLLAAAPCAVHAERNCGGAGMPSVNMRDGKDNLDRGADVIEDLFQKAGDNKEAKEIANRCADTFDEIRRMVTTFTFSFDLFNFDYEKILQEAAEHLMRKLEEYCKTAIQSAKDKVRNALYEKINEGKEEVQQQVNMEIPSGSLDSSKIGANFKLPVP